MLAFQISRGGNSSLIDSYDKAKLLCFTHDDNDESSNVGVNDDDDDEEGEEEDLGGTHYNGLYGEAPPERGTFFTLRVYERAGISRVEVYERVGKSVI